MSVQRCWGRISDIDYLLLLRQALVEAAAEAVVVEALCGIDGLTGQSGWQSEPGRLCRDPRMKYGRWMYETNQQAK